GKLRASPARARWKGGAVVTSRPASSTAPAVGRRSPLRTSNRVVLPAPLGPRTAMISPGRTPSVTSRRIRTPPMVTLSARVASTSGTAGHRWGDLVRREGGDQLGHVLAVACHQPGLEHRLQQRVVL